MGNRESRSFSAIPVVVSTVQFVLSVCVCVSNAACTDEFGFFGSNFPIVQKNVSVELWAIPVCLIMVQAFARRAT